MTTPLDEGQNPENLGERHARPSVQGGDLEPVDLGAYPEFFEYGETGTMPRAAEGEGDTSEVVTGPGTGRRRRSGRLVPDPAVGEQAGTVPRQDVSAGGVFTPPSGRPIADPSRRAFPFADQPGAPSYPPPTGEPLAIREPAPYERAPEPPLRQRSTQAPAPGYPHAPAPGHPTAPPAPSAPTIPPPRDTGLPRRSRATATPGTRRTPLAPPPPPKAALVPAVAVQGTGRRRAKRSALSYLWPFQAFTGARPSSTRIRSRSTAATVWRRLKADRPALAGAITIGVLILLAVFAPAISGLFGVDPTTPHYDLTSSTFGPHGSFGGMSWAHPLGVDQALGRDILSRLLYGARVSLLVAFAATILSVGLGATLGLVAGYLGGRVDGVISRLMDLFLAFPLLLFALGLNGALTDKAFGLSGNALRIAVMIFVMGFFNWPYIARIVRAEVLSLREREFVDAARQLGAGARWVIGRELLPNLMSPILVYATLVIPANIIFEAGLSTLGVGLNPPTASWGQMLLDASATVNTDPAYLVVPGMAVFITVLAFNLFGDGLRDALDPTAQ